MLRKTMLLTVLMLFLIGVPTSYGVNMKDGLWEITSKIEMPGMPFAMPPQTFRQCLTKDNMIPRKEEGTHECKILDKEIKGNTFTWTIRCTGSEGTYLMKGKTTYNRDRFTGEMEMTSPDGTEMVQHMKGRRIGECNQ